MYGKKLKEIRKCMSVTQDSMADILGVSGRNYAAYERDENTPPYSMLVTLCKNYNINLNWFIADIGNMLNAPKFEQVQGGLTLEVRKILREEGLIK